MGASNQQLDRWDRGSGTLRKLLDSFGDSLSASADGALFAATGMTRADLDRWGYCLVREALEPEALAAVRGRLLAVAEAELRRTGGRK